MMRKKMFQPRISLSLSLLATMLAAALTLLPPTSAAHRTASAPGDADLSNEARDLDSFGSALFKYEQKCAELDKKSALTRAEFESVKSGADDLNSRVSQVQGVFRSIIEKLKRANQWDDFDNIALQKMMDGSVRTFLREEGGAKRVLESAAAQAGAITSDVNALRERLKAKVREQSSSFTDADNQDSGWRILPASYAASAHALLSGKCFFAKVSKFVSAVAHGGCPTSNAAYSACQACGQSLTNCPECALN
ncbi:MAG: hypothetical protein M3362_28125 [Acidobacteriota bacterium]|nr:hypothetical protein [Acidobacteriota bacterium]